MTFLLYVLLYAIIARWYLGRRRAIIKYTVDDYCTYLNSGALALLFLMLTQSDVGQYYLIVGHVPRPTNEVVGVLYFMMPCLTNIVIMSITSIKGFSYYQRYVMCTQVFVYIVCYVLIKLIPAYDWYNVSVVRWTNDLKIVTIAFWSSQLVQVISLMVASRYVGRSKIRRS